MSFPSENSTRVQGLRPRHPCRRRRPIGRIAFGVCYPSLHTPSQRPTAVGGWRNERLGGALRLVRCCALRVSASVPPARRRLPA
jgi:hypothetical protein